MSHVPFRSLALAALAACFAMTSGCAEGPEGDEPIVDETPPQALTATSATVYEHSNFGGRWQEMPVGRYYGPALFLYKSISSLRIPPHHEAILCDEGHACNWYRGDVAYVGDGMNDRAVDVQIRPMAIVFEHANYQGKSQDLGDSTHGYRADSGALSIVGNDAISSILLPPGHYAFLCKNESDSEWQCLKLTASSPYIGNAFNDQVSKVFIKRL